MSHDPVQAELIAVLVAVTHGDPRVLTIESGAALPSGQLETGHRSLQAGLRAWVERQTHHPLGYVEQLYTFADQQRLDGSRSISISYLGLSREGAHHRCQYRLVQLVHLFPLGGPASADHADQPRDLASAGRLGRRRPRAGSFVSPACSARMGGSGTRNWCCNATSFSTRPGWSRKRSAPGPACRADPLPGCGDDA